MDQHGNAQATRAAGEASTRILQEIQTHGKQ